MAERSSGPANRIIACGIPSVTAARAPEYQLAVNMFRGPVDLLQRMLGWPSAIVYTGPKLPCTIVYILDLSNERTADQTNDPGPWTDSFQPFDWGCSYVSTSGPGR